MTANRAFSGLLLRYLLTNICLFEHKLCSNYVQTNSVREGSEGFTNKLELVAIFRWVFPCIKRNFDFDFLLVLRAAFFQSFLSGSVLSERL